MFPDVFFCIMIAVHVDLVYGGYMYCLWPFQVYFDRRASKRIHVMYMYIM